MKSNFSTLILLTYLNFLIFPKVLIPRLILIPNLILIVLLSHSLSYPLTQYLLERQLTLITPSRIPKQLLIPPPLSTIHRLSRLGRITLQIREDEILFACPFRVLEVGR